MEARERGFLFVRNAALCIRTLCKTAVAVEGVKRGAAESTTTTGRATVA